MRSSQGAKLCDAVRRGATKKGGLPKWVVALSLGVLRRCAIQCDVVRRSAKHARQDSNLQPAD